MRQRITPGGTIDVFTADEFHRIIKRDERNTRIRGGETVQLDATGTGKVDVYKVPIGTEFQIRRIQFELSGVGPTNLQTATISLATVGNSLQYRRSDTPIGWGNPVSPVGGNGRIPGTETWGDQQGPYLANGEVFSVAVILGAAAASTILTVMVEGILTENRKDT